MESQIYIIKTTANREDQVMDFITGHVEKKGIDVYCVIRPHGMRGYIFVEAKDKESAEKATQGVPYAKGILAVPVDYHEIEPMLEQVKVQYNIEKNDIV